MKIAAVIAVIAIIVLFVMLRPKPDISGQQARELVAGGAQLIDVRTPTEFGQAHIEGARNIPVDLLSSRLDELAKNKPVVVYCRSGARSTRAATLLRSKGFTAVHNLGSMGAW